jgi:hypothetical protein
VHNLQTETAPVKGNANNNLAPPPVLHVAKPPFTRAGAYLNRRFCIHPEIADLVAAFAGIGPNGSAL